MNVLLFFLYPMWRIMCCIMRKLTSFHDYHHVLFFVDFFQTCINFDEIYQKSMILYNSTVFSLHNYIICMIKFAPKLPHHEQGVGRLVASKYNRLLHLDTRCVLCTCILANRPFLQVGISIKQNIKWNKNKRGPDLGVRRQRRLTPSTLQGRRK